MGLLAWQLLESMVIMCKQINSKFIVLYSAEEARVVQQPVLLYSLADSALVTHSFTVAAAIINDWHGFSWQTTVCLWYCSLVASFPPDC